MALFRIQWANNNQNMMSIYVSCSDARNRLYETLILFSHLSYRYTRQSEKTEPLPL